MHNKNNNIRNEGYYNKKNAFTLAEVLITIAVIGIVAAMTLPTVVAKYKDKVLLNQAKRAYSIISNAMLKTKAVNNYDSYGDLFNNNRTNDEILEILSKEFNPIKLCKENQGGCFNWKVASSKKMAQNGKTAYYDFSKYASMVLNDGSVLYVNRYNHNGDCGWYNEGYKTDDKGFIMKDEDGNPIKYSLADKRCGSIKIDVNGKKGPNQLGADVFDVDILPQKVTLQYYTFLYDDTLRYEYYQEGVEL